MELLQEFENVPRIKRKESMIEYWNARQFSDPELFKLAQVVMGTPMTQVSVESAFSGLKFILSDQRSNLNADILEEICFIRSNHIFNNK